ncbi:MAG: hypothetical protein ABI134_32230 [Byssovorax sp.]
MSAANIARSGYARTVVGAWDLGNGLRLGIGIGTDEPRAARFALELFGPTAPLLLLGEQAAALLEAAPSAPPVEKRTPLAVLMASLSPLRRGAPSTLPFSRILRTAYALGAPLGEDDDIAQERTLEGFAEALARRDAAGLGFDLTRVATTLAHHIAEQPYFSDVENPRWWQGGLIVIPLPPEPPRLSIPRAALLCVRTDPAGKALALTTLLTVGDRLIATAARVLARAPEILCEEDEINTMEGWT